MRIITISLVPYRKALKVAFCIFFCLCALGITVGAVRGVIDYTTYENASSDSITGRVIIIDAGHGGEDAGAVARDGTLEKDLNLSIALELGKQLSEKGYTVVYTRTSDKMLYSAEENIKGMRKLSDLKGRLKVAEDYQDSLFISIHVNSYGAEKCSGMQVYYTDGNEESRSLASYIQSNTKDRLQQENNRKIKSGKHIFLLENSSVNTVLVECGFITNESECKKLSEKEYQKQLCFAIVCGIIEYEESIVQ